jgi:hypothetical protein
MVSFTVLCRCVLLVQMAAVSAFAPAARSRFGRIQKVRVGCVNRKRNHLLFAHLCIYIYMYIYILSILLSITDDGGVARNEYCGGF